jgi:hypothetical protein
MKLILLSAASPRPEPGFFKWFAGAPKVAQPPTKKLGFTAVGFSLLSGLGVAAITRFKRMIFNRKVLFLRVEINE